MQASHSQETRTRVHTPGESATDTEPVMNLTVERASSDNTSANLSMARDRCILLDAPLDMVHEILRYLYPMDILNLARTNDALRGFLMSRRRSKAVWRAARGNIKGLPDCPIHMSEPAYANLAFGLYCHKCAEPGSHDVIWGFSGRYCKKCLNTFDVVWSDGYVEAYLQDVLGDNFKLNWAPYLLCYSPDGKSELYHRSACEDFAKHVLEVRDDQDALDAYLVDIRDLVDGIRPHARACHEWYEDFLEQRLQDIIARLHREAGWHRVLAIMSEENYAPLRSHPLVMISKVLTEQEWDDIRGSIVVSLEEYEEMHLRKERLSIIRTRLLHLRWAVYKAQLGERGLLTVDYEYGPKLADIALMPEFRDIVESTNDVDVNRRSFRDALAHLPALTERFNRQRKNTLLELMAERLGYRGVQMHLLELAVAWFHCDKCDKYMRWHNVLAHQCQRPYYADTEREDFADPYEWDAAEASMFHAWSAKDLRPILAEDLSVLRSLIVACGLDPDTATAEEMDVLDARFVCEEIPVPWARKSEGQLVMNWRRAVLSVHMVRGCDSVNWLCVSIADKQRALPLEEKARRAALRNPENQKFLHCALCDEPWWLVTDSLGDAFLVADHLKRNHRVPMRDVSASGEYMYIHPDGKPETAAVWLPFQ
ncbi:hypothetical protein DAEQUDRAFT_770195 [Daedalea quercina L-15889]|uniref:F-box domain-containing protein n=1 Tax=Daedalea quercina L-15889 TaxID=1314783 RepID=A0A165L199_9APHY|nr:hypothetical protein DAEQUDRAFT_770195 [Daedalea quercina L-15889]